MLDLNTALTGRALSKHAQVFVRQSSDKQRQEHTGSADLQLQEAAYLEVLGWPADRIEVVDARGESGRAGAHRPQFAHLLESVRSGRVGIVAVGRSDRLGRNDVDSAIFLEAAALSHTLVMVGGRIYNPASDADSMMLGMMAKFAEYENKARTRWMMSSRLAKARKLEQRILLPTGLVWASPQDGEYVARLQASGLTHWLEQLDEHQEMSSRNGIPYHILPYPDAEVARSVELRIRWLLETGDLGEVLQRIYTDPLWPRPGRIPVLRAVRYLPGQTPEWKGGTRSQQWARLKQWFDAPALYGAYSFRAPRLAQITLGEESAAYEVRIDAAFPSFAQPEDERRVRAILAAPKRGWKRGSYTGPRPHALECLRCAVPDANGTPCGLRMTAMYTEGGKYGYYSQACTTRGHAVSHVRGSIDEQVLDMVLGVFDEQAVREAVSSLRVNTGNASSRRRELEAEVKQLEERMRAASELEVQAQLDRDPQSRLHWQEQRREFAALREARESQLQGARAEEEALRTLSREDLERILTLGGDLRTLLARARASDPASLRYIVRELVEAVHFRRISSFAYAIEVEFPSGQRIGRTVFTRNFAATQPARAWAHGRLAEGADPATLAEELNWAPPLNHRVPWDPERVTTASFLHEDAAPLREGEPQAARVLADCWAVPYRDVLVAAFQAKLGPAVFREGDLLLCPTEGEVHAALPEAARRDVAREQGWPADDTALLAQLREQTGQSKHTLKQLALAGSGLGRDATGRLYARLSEVTVGLAEAIRRTLQEKTPEQLHLDPTGWIPLADAVRRSPGVDRNTLLKRLPHVRPGMGHDGAKSVFVWLAPEPECEAMRQGAAADRPA